MKIKILLTGGSGMVGKNLLEHPDQKAFKIIAPTRRELDLFDFGNVIDFLKQNRPDIVLHAAGKVGGIHANITAPVSFLVENMDMGRNVILAARKAGVQRLLNLGSSCMYPRNASNPLREEMVLSGELEPTNEGYALAKIMTARLCEYISHEDASYQYKTLIPCNIYGRHDKFDPSQSHLVPAIIHKIYQAIENNHAPVEVWGDGTARREFMYASDLADAILRTMKDFDAIPSYMNIGVGHDYTISEYYEAVASVLGYKGDFVYDRSKPVGMTRKLVSIERQSAWGWSAQTDLHEGITKTYEFYLKGQFNEC
jgi:GDP-L-fucose synthase